MSKLRLPKYLLEYYSVPQLNEYIIAMEKIKKYYINRKESSIITCPLCDVGRKVSKENSISSTNSTCIVCMWNTFENTYCLDWLSENTDGWQCFDILFSMNFNKVRRERIAMLESWIAKVKEEIAKRN